MPPTSSTRLTAAAGFLLAPSLALSASILVNTADDELNNDGDCSLREAVQSANTNPVSGVDDCNAGNAGSDTITILANGTITLSNELTVTEALSIRGLGAEATVLDGNGQNRHFVVDMPDNTHDFSLSSMTLEDGRSDEAHAAGEVRGGGSLRIVQAGTVFIDSVRFRGNRAITATKLDIRGGAIVVVVPDGNGSRLEIRDSLFEDNESRFMGGAIAIASGSEDPSVETLLIERTRFIDNTADGRGGAIQGTAASYSIADSVFTGNATASENVNRFGGAAALSTPASALSFIERTSFLDNQSIEQGGALYLKGGVQVIRNSTFHGNQAQTGGQAIELANGAVAALFFATLHDNGRGLAADEAIRVCSNCSLSLTHSIVWSGWEPNIDCRTLGGSITSTGHNIDSSGTCTSENSDLPMTDPELFAPGDYGDSVPDLVVPTMLPNPDSPAVQGGASSCPGPFAGATSQDQRGQPRPVAGPEGTSALCDIGAVEFQAGDDPVIFADRFEGSL
jgi:CSLREA domain-containing protein